MSDKSLGTRSTRYAEQMAHRWLPCGGDHHLYVERTVTLTHDLAAVESRRISAFRFLRGSEEIRLTRESAVWLHRALGAALAATEGEDAL